MTVTECVPCRRVSGASSQRLSQPIACRHAWAGSVGWASVTALPLTTVVPLDRRENRGPGSSGSFLQGGGGAREQARQDATPGGQPLGPLSYPLLTQPPARYRGLYKTSGFPLGSGRAPVSVSVSVHLHVSVSACASTRVSVSVHESERESVRRHLRVSVHP